MGTGGTRKNQAHKLLRRYWGHTDFWPGQWEVIEAFLAGRDTVAVLQTGGGKSLCYQLPALFSDLSDGIVMVVSPLIALMRDQVNGLAAKGVEATHIDSNLSPHDRNQRWTDAERGRYRLVYVSPERLFSDVFHARARRLRVNLLAVDEAHCVSEWGHMFRPSYRRIPDVYGLLGRPPVMTVTATATPEVRRDIEKQLVLHDPCVVVRGFDRPNIYWSLLGKGSKQERVQHVLDRVPGCGLLYVATRRSTERWARRLQEQGEEVVTYHAGRDAHERKEAQKAWMDGHVRLMVATNAFGMGIDKKDVRFVIHMDMPGSLEAYYQESGRAGRDGLPAHAALLFSPRDKVIREALLANSHPDPEDAMRVYEAVSDLEQIPLHSRPEEPVFLDMEALSTYTGFAQRRIRNAVTLIVRQGIWTQLPMEKHQGLIRFLHTSVQVRNYAVSVQSEALATFIITLLRMVHAEAFGRWCAINMQFLERRMSLGREQIERNMKFLEQRGILAWRNMDQTMGIRFRKPRTDRLSLDETAVRTSKKYARQRLDEMIRYTRSTTCRRAFLLSYFGEEYGQQTCGRCDVCRAGQG